MEKYSHRLMLGCSATAILLSMGTSAFAQEGNETVVVSSTRLQNAGFDAPTPTTVIGAAQIEKNAQPSVFETMTQLPALQGSTGVSYNTGSTTTGLQGISSLNLRGLGVLRTLTLIDNQRIVASNPNGAVDVSQMPQMLIQRVDIVTGGASASWGSDAVAGVVNFVTDKKFEGFKTNFLMGQTTFGDDQNITAQFAVGTAFLGGRAHIEVAGEYSYTAGVQPILPVAANQFGQIENIGGREFPSQRSILSYGAPANVTNYVLVGGVATPVVTPVIPVGQPQNNYADHVQPTQTYPTAIILSGPKQGTVFGANGMAQAYNFAGNCTPAYNGSATGAGGINGSIGGSCIGTAANPGDQTAHQYTHSLASPLTRGDVYTRMSYDLAPGTEIYATVNMSVSRTQDIPAQGNSNRTGVPVACDNAFIAQSGLFGIGLPYQQAIAACNTAYANVAAVTALDAGGVSRTITPAQSYSYVNPGVTNGRYDFYNTISSGTQGANGNGLGPNPQPTGYLIGGVQQPVQAFDMATQSANINFDQIVNLTRSMRRFVVGGDGGFSVFGTDWTWDSYFQHGENDVSIRILNMPLKNRYNQAIDAIQDPVTGAIECRDPIARANGCVPYNPFTTSAPSPAAIAYIDNQANGVRNAGQLARQQMRQEAFSVNFAGSPLELWAGKLAVAAGFDYREEEFAQQADPYSGGITSSTPSSFNQPCTDPSIDCVASGTIVNGVAHVNPGNWNAGNYTSGQGNYHVWEIYTEVGVPIFDTPEFGKLDATLAGRFERYSTAGDFTTWKLGVTWETPIPGIRFRALQSRDTRAPNLADLFLPKQTLNGSFNNTFQNPIGNNQQVGQTNAGNPLLQPEKGTTTELGLVYQPEWLPGFSTSFDYYRIAVKGIISASGVQTVENLCSQGFTQYCAQQFIATKNGLPQTTTPGAQGAKGDDNEVLSIVAVPFNSAGLLTDGFDIESSYQFDLQNWDVPGSFALRSLINHTMKFLSDPGVAGQFTTERAGVLGGGFNSDTYSANTGNVLTWKLTESQDWQGETWGFTLQERWSAGGVTNGKWTSANNPLGLPNGTQGLHYVTCTPGSCPAATSQMPTINYQTVSSVMYLDVGGSYRLNEKSQFYFKIDNIANQKPPALGSNETNNTLYDVLGRMYRVGFRFND